MNNNKWPGRVPKDHPGVTLANWPPAGGLQNATNTPVVPSWAISNSWSGQAADAWINPANIYHGKRLERLGCRKFINKIIVVVVVVVDHEVWGSLAA